MTKALDKAARLIRFVLFPSRRAERRRRVAFDELFRAVEGGAMVVAAPQFGGSFEMDCRSHVLKRVLVERSYESDVAEAVRRRIDRQRDAIDIGANTGLFSVLMSRLLAPAGRVLAIEPTPGAARLLRRNLERNQCRNATVFEGVAAERAGTFTIHVIPGMEEYSTLGAMVHPSIAGRQHEALEVAGDTIDNLVSRLGLRPGLIKIDAEGAESAVLAGCRRTLQQHRPVILCEAWPQTLVAASGTADSSIDRIFGEHGYSLQAFSCGEILALPR